MTAIDSTLSTSRRPSLIGAADTRRVQSDSVVQQSGPSDQTWYVHACPYLIEEFGAKPTIPCVGWDSAHPPYPLPLLRL